MSAAPIPTQASAAAVERIMSRSKDVSVLPHVVFQIMEMTASEESSAGTLERSVVVDPGFSAKLLTQANSAALGLPKKVSSIREAIMFLGFKQVRCLAMTVGVFDMFVGKTDKESLRRRKWWRHSLDTAVGARLIATKTKKCDPETAYTCGLLHYLGKTILCRYNSTEYERVEIAEQKVDSRKAEVMVFGCDHVDILLAAAKAWGFPESLSQGLNYADQPEDDDPGKGLRTVVGLADWLAEKVLEGDLSALTADGHWAVAALGLDETQLAELAREVQTALSDAARHGM
ncbi:MAG: HDOD domain-containing protein [Fimbriimonadaceae bacterium]|nr:HDOD domain-containing protein [Fimbriimonadaceae bacterium]